jgi:hypothetical protein
MRMTQRSASEAAAVTQAANEPLKPGDYPAEIREAANKVSARENDMIELLVAVFDVHGNERLLRDFLVDTPRGAAKLFSACEAVGIVGAHEIDATDFAGKRCRVRVSIEKRRGYPPRNVVESYGVADAVVNLRPAGAR